MLALAAARLGGRGRLRCLDMRHLPRLGQFDLVTCLDDSINHLLDPEDVRDAFRGMAANLAPDGLLAFDVNTTRAYRSAWANTEVTDVEGHVVAWRGLCSAEDSVDGGLGEVQIDVFAPARDGLWTRTVSVHRERHSPIETTPGLVEAA